MVQDFVNTADLEGGTDRLRDVDELAAFCAAHHIPVGTLSERDVATCRDLREAIRDACRAHAGIPLPTDSAGSLRRLLRRGQLILTIDETGAAAISPAPGLGAANRVIAVMAAAIAAAAAEGTWTRLKACEAHQCQWVYYDRSPASRSRWCTMSICGSRAKMRAYRSRKA